MSTPLSLAQDPLGVILCLLALAAASITFMILFVVKESKKRYREILMRQHGEDIPPIVLPQAIRDEFEKTIVYTGEGRLTDDALIHFAQLRNNGKAERVLEVKRGAYFIESRPIAELFDVECVPRGICDSTNLFLVFRLADEADEFARWYKKDYILSMDPIEFHGSPPGTLIVT